MESVNANIYHLPRHYDTNLEIPPTNVVYHLQSNYKFDFKSAVSKIDVDIFCADKPKVATDAVPTTDQSTSLKHCVNGVMDIPGLSEEAQLDRATTELKDRHVALLKRLEDLRAKIEKHPAKATSPVPEKKPDKAKLLAEKISRNADRPVPSSIHSYNNDTFSDKFIAETLSSTGPPVVLTIDPTSPSANSVAALLKYLKYVRAKKLLLKSHRHSSINSDAAEKLEYINADLNYTRKGSQNHCLDIVWRSNSCGICLDLGPKNGGELVGDRAVVQFLAVLANLYPGVPGAQSPSEADNSLDRWLEVLGHWTTDMNKKMRDALVKELNVTLGSREFILGDQFSLADIVLFGYTFSLKESGLGLPGNVSKWLARCAEYMMFSCFELDDNMAN